MSVEPRVVEYGDSAVLVEMRGASAEARWEGAKRLAESLDAASPSGLVDLVASYEDVFVEFDPLMTSHETLRALLDQAWESAGDDPRTPREFAIPVVYGGDFGPDLELVAEELGMTPDELIEQHSCEPWTVRFRGAPVGSPMMDRESWAGPVSRVRTPRVRLPWGSVGLSGRQCLVYPVASPGGWKLIGRSPLRLVHPDHPRVVAYRPGDLLRFTPIPASQWEDSVADLLPDPVGPGGGA